MTIHHPHYLLTLPSVRERCETLADRIKGNSLTNFDVDLGRMPQLVELVCKTITKDYGSGPDFSAIPPHGRWQHFEAGGVPRIDHLIAQWQTQGPTGPVSGSDLTIGTEPAQDEVAAGPKQGHGPDNREVCRRLFELFFVAVLLDAGAGTLWKYNDKENNLQIGRSEGLAIAALNMYKNGVFSSHGSDPNRQFRVDGACLAGLDSSVFCEGMQSSGTNPLAGVEGRLRVLQNLGSAMSSVELAPLFNTQDSPSRLGNFVDWVENQRSAENTVDLFVLWDTLMRILDKVWPAGRTQFDGVSLGDAWPCSSIGTGPNGEDPFKHIVPFHKLTQWLTYSLMTPIERFLGVTFTHTEHLTGLPEYRNGGLLVDMGVLQLKEEALQQGIAQAEKSNKSAKVPLFTVDSDTIVEWRAVTVLMLDQILTQVNDQLGSHLSLAQLLEAGTWKAGRVVAAEKRPATNGPPIDIISDGTVF